jgi:hypothetical protein
MQACIEKRLRRLGLWTLEERCNRADLIELYKVNQGLTGLKFDSIFEKSSTTHLGLLTQAAEKTYAIGTSESFTFLRECRPLE